MSYEGIRETHKPTLPTINCTDLYQIADDNVHISSSVLFVLSCDIDDVLWLVALFKS